MNQLNDIDKLIARKIGQREASPPLRSFSEISKRMKWVNFWKFGVMRILIVNKIIYLIVPLLLTTVVLVKNFHSETNNMIKAHKKGTQLSAHSKSLKSPSENNLRNSETLNNQQDLNNKKINNLMPGNHNGKEPAKNQHINSRGTHHNTNEPELNEVISYSGILSNIIVQDKQTTSFNSESSALKIPLKNRNILTSSLMTNSDKGENNAPNSVLLTHNFKMMPPIQHKLPEPELERKDIHSEKLRNRWTTSAGLSTGIHHILWASSLYNNNIFSQSKIFEGNSIQAEFQIENENFAIISGIDFSSFNQQFSAEKLFYNPYTDIVYNYSGNFINIDSAGLWHYYYTADSTIHLVDSVWSWSVDTTIVHLYDTNYVHQSDTMKNARWSAHYQQFSVPLLLSKKIVAGRFVFSVSGGVSLGVIKANHGYVFYSEQSAMPFRTLRSLIPGNYFTISAVAMLSTGYFLSDRTVFELKPFFTYQLNKISIQEQNTAIQFHRLGLAVGLRYYF
jgi:hypothetical protein